MKIIIIIYYINIKYNVLPQLLVQHPCYCYNINLYNDKTIHLLYYINNNLKFTVKNLIHSKQSWIAIRNLYINSYACISIREQHFPCFIVIFFYKFVFVPIDAQLKIIIL